MTEVNTIGSILTHIFNREMEEMKKRFVIFGAGGTGRNAYYQLQNDKNIDIVAFIDNFKKGELFGLPIYKPQKLNVLQYDSIYLATVAFSEVMAQLLEMGIDEKKIIQSTAAAKWTAREAFLTNLAQELYRKNIPGSVAEAGVFRGEFAKLINQRFPDRKLYLFDTFQGFDSRDIAYEAGYDADPTKGDYFEDTSVELIMSKMLHPENVIICRGYVPESFIGVDDRFCFVNLDMDLYKPTLEALRWFYPRMNKGGGILIHDYFDTYSFPNLKKGVIEFGEETGAQFFPIGDYLSVFIIKGI